ncbi:TetR/AcrR family transcriptional regulator [Streptomyces sp900105755]|uniref:TetR/AcrR family transcriptional regulator n=1 Tax=Streptomyces sp. 900105755 TaxID=3154389 RepID=A0ABV1TVF9_9ACTN
MHLFWERGYAGCSLDSLLSAMGIGRRSLYDTFGDKRTLFLRCLTSYTAASERAERDLADSATDARSAIDKLLRSPIAPSGGTSVGCLAVNTATELATNDEEVTRELQRHFAASRQLLTDQVLRGRADGSVTARRDPDTIVAMLFNAWTGLRVRARAGMTGLEGEVDALVGLLH